MNDKEMLELLKRKPQRGLDTLIGLYSGLLYAVARGRMDASLYGSAQVEDIVADSFSDFYLSLDSFDPDRCSIKSFLCVIARRKAIDAVRSSKLTQLPLDEAEDTLSLEEETEEKELRARLIQEIGNLGEPDSAILIRKYYLGQSSKDIAAALGLSPSNVDTRTHRAVQKLKKIFGGAS